MSLSIRDCSLMTVGQRFLRIYKDWEIKTPPIKETKMFKNRFILVLGVLSLLLVTMAVSNPFSNSSPVGVEGASDFYQRHPDWTWASRNQNAAVPVTGASDFSDYYQRHPELSAPVEVSIDTTDFYFRHHGPLSLARLIDLTDYFFRHLELKSR
jgi:hypothetical protein